MLLNAATLNSSVLNGTSRATLAAGIAQSQSIVSASLHLPKPLRGPLTQRQQGSYGRNLFTYSDDLHTAVSNSNACTYTPLYVDGTPEGGIWATILQDQNHTHPYAGRAFTTIGAGYYTITLWMLAGTNTTSSLIVFNSAISVAQTIYDFAVLSGPAGGNVVNGAILDITNLSTSTWSKIRLTVSGLSAATVYKLLVYAHTQNGTPGNGTIIVTEFQATPGLSAEPYVQTFNVAAAFTPDLVTRALLAAVSAQSASTSPILTTRAILSATASQVQTTTPTLTTRAILSAAVTQLQSVSGNESTRPLLSAAATQVQSPSATILLQKFLGTTVQSVAQVLSSYLSIPKPLLATAYQAHTLAGDLTAFGRYIFTLQYQAHTATGELITRALLGAVATQTQSKISAGLIVPIGFDVALTQAHSVSGTIGLLKYMSGDPVFQVQTATSDLTTRVILPAQAMGQTQVSAAGILTRSLLSASTVQVQTSLGADITTSARLSVASTQVQIVAATLTTKPLLAASATQAQVASATELVLLKGMYASAIQSWSHTALINIGKELNAHKQGTATATADLAIRKTFEGWAASYFTVITSRLRGRAEFSVTVSCRMTAYLESATGVLPPRVLSSKIARDVQQPERAGVL